MLRVAGGGGRGQDEGGVRGRGREGGVGERRVRGREGVEGAGGGVGKGDKRSIARGWVDGIGWGVVEKGTCEDSGKGVKGKGSDGG